MRREKFVVLALIFLLSTQSLTTILSPDNLADEIESQAQLNSTTETSADTAVVFLHSRTTALQMGNTSTIQVMNHEIGSNEDTINATQTLDVTAYLDPVFATSATLNGQIRFALWIRGSGGPNSKATIDFTLEKTDANGTIQGLPFATVTSSNVVFPTTYTEHTATVSVSNVQFNQGERIKLSVDVSGNNGISYMARWGSQLFQSRVELPITTPIEVVSNDYKDGQGQSTDTYWIGTTVGSTSLDLNLASPLTINHIDSVTARLRAPNGTIMNSYNLSTTSPSWQANGVWTQVLPFNGNSLAGDWTMEYEIDSLDASRRLATYPGDTTANGLRIYENITIPVRYSAFLTVNCFNADNVALSNVDIEVTAENIRRVDLDKQCDSTGSVTMELPMSNISLDFFYQDIQVSNQVLAFSGNQSLDVLTDVSDVTLNATHSDGRPAGMINVWVVHPNGTLILSGHSFNSTMTISDAPKGQYVISSSWMGNPLPNTVGTHLGEAGGTEININTTVIGTIVQVTDQEGVAIEGVQLIARDKNTQTIRAAATTLANGLAAFDLMSDDYVIEPVWQRFSFPSQNVTFDGTQVNLTLELMKVNVNIMDNDNNALPFANLRVLDENNQTIILADTNASGMGDLRLPSGTYPLAVQWSSTYFAVGDMTVSPNATWNITVPVGAFTFNIQTPENDPIDGAIIKIEDDAGVIWSGLVTDSTGSTSIRAPEGDYAISVELDGFLIHSQNQYLSFANRLINISVVMPDVFVTVSTIDGQILDSVELQIQTIGGSVLDTGLTDENGTATMRAPDGDHILTARWLGNEIGQMNLTVSGTTFVNFSAEAYIVSFNAIDRSNNPVDNVTLLIRKDASAVILATAQTDSTGSVDVLLPAGDYTVQGSWFGIEVLNTNLTVNSQMSIDVTVEVISVELNVVDVDGEVLNGARVDLLRNGVYASTSTVNANGRANFRVAAGTYTSVVTWFGIEVNRTEVVFNAEVVEIPTIVAEVSSVYVEVVDRDGLPVDGITVTIRDDFIILDQNISADGGNLRLRLPYGVYDATATMSGILVAEINNFTAPGEGVVIIEIALEKIDLTLTDLDDQPINEIQVFAHDPRTFGVMIAISDENGIASLRLPEGVYDLDFSWKGRIISTANLSIPLTADADFQLPLREHTIFVTDADGEIAQGVLVTLRDPSDTVLTSEILSQTGSITTLVGSGSHRLSVSWAGLGLYNEYYSPVNMTSHDVVLPIGKVELKVKDLDGEPLANLDVVIRLDSGRLLDVVTTNSTGASGLYLPESNIVVTLQMQGYVIHEAPVFLNGQDLIEMTAPVRTRTFNLEDTAGNPLSNAQMYLVTESGLRVGPSVSDGNGEFTVFLLPGELWLDVQWNNRGVLYTNMTDNQAPDVLTAAVHTASLTFVSPLEAETQVVRNVALRDAVSGLTHTLPPSQIIQIAEGNHSISLVWQDVALPEVALTIDASDDFTVELPLVVMDLEFMRLDKSDLNTEVLVRVEQGVWSHEFTTFGNSTFVVPPGSVAMDVHLDGALLKEVTLREEMHDIMLPINTYTLDILRGDNAIIDTERIEVKWSGSDWIDMTEVGVTGPSNEDWDARISYKGWYFERVMTIPTVNTEAKIWVEIANVSLDVLDRNGDSLKETSCTFTGPEGMMTVVTDTTTSNFELLSGNYAYSCRVPSAGEVEDDGRRSSKEFTGDLIATADGSNKLVIDVVELPFSESEQVKGILSSGVGLTIGIIALIGWAIALFSMNKISNLKREKEETGEFISESTVPSAPTQAAPASEFDVDDLFD